MMSSVPMPSLPQWAAQARHGDLFELGPWFAHFVATALPVDAAPLFVEIGPTDAGDRLALALKTARGDVAPYCSLLDGMSNYYSCGFGPIAAAAPGAVALQALGDALADAGRAFDAIRLGPLSADSAFAQTCEQRLRKAGFVTYWTLAYRNWFATTEGLSFGDYLARVPSSFPATSEKRRQAFLRKRMGSIVITQSAEGLDGELAAYASVYDASWKVSEPFPAFVPGLIQLAAREGWLRLGVLRVGDEAAAVQLWFVVDGRALIYKVAYAERFVKLSVGSILTVALLDHVLSVDKVREIDFLSGDDPYKQKWMFARRDKHRMLAFNRRRWRGLVGALRESIAQRRNRVDVGTQ